MGTNAYELVANLERSYNALWRGQKLFFPKTLKASLEVYRGYPDSIASLWVVCRAFLDTKPAMQKRFRFLRWFAESDFIEACNVLSERGLFSGELAYSNFERLAKVNYPQLVMKLEKKQLLTGEGAQGNFQIVMEQEKDPESLIDVLEKLAEGVLLKSEFAESNRKLAANFRFLQTLPYDLDVLKKGGLWNSDEIQYYFQLVVTYESRQKTSALAPNAGDMAQYLVNMHEKKLLEGIGARANAKLVWEIAREEEDYRGTDIIDRLDLMNKAGLLDEEDAQFYRDAVRSDRGRWSCRNIAVAFIDLHKNGSLKGVSGKANREAVLADDYCRNLASILITLNRASLLSGDLENANRESVVGYKWLITLDMALSRLHSAQLLNQINFNTLMSFHNILLQVPREIWLQMEPHKLTSERLEEIFQICRENTQDEKSGRRIFRNYVTQFLAHPSWLVPPRSPYTNSSCIVFFASEDDGIQAGNQPATGGVQVKLL